MGCAQPKIARGCRAELPSNGPVLKCETLEITLLDTLTKLDVLARSEDVFAALRVGAVHILCAASNAPLSSTRAAAVHVRPCCQQNIHVDFFALLLCTYLCCQQYPKSRCTAE